MLSILRMDIRQVLGRNIRRFRTLAGLSQEAVGALIGADRAHVSAMERGRQNITVVTLWHVARALGVRPVDLLDEDFGNGGAPDISGGPAPPDGR